MAENDSRRNVGRRKAQDQFAKISQRDDVFRHERERAHAADTGKIARLKALRLAKEEDERAESDAAVKAGKEPAPAARLRKRAMKKAPSH